MLYILWKKDEIISFLRKMGVHLVQTRNDFIQINNNTNNLITFSTIYHLLVFLGLLGIMVSPIFTSERNLPVNTYIPFDWRNKSILYVIAFAYVTYALIFSGVFTVFTVMLWYLMMSCVTKYKLLGYDLKHIHLACESKLKKENISVVEKQNLFLKELIVLIKNHQHIQE